MIRNTDQREIEDPTYKINLFTEVLVENGISVTYHE